MSILVLPVREKIIESEKSFRSQSVNIPTPVSGHALVSIISIAVFLGYICLEATTKLALIPAAQVFYASLALVAAPACALIFSVMSLKHGIKLRSELRGMTLAYISFFFSALYFVTAFALPIVFFGLFIIYAYIW